MSMGGATGQIVFATDEDAIVFAKVMWGLFGPLGALDEGLRPFGQSVLDGFDIGNISVSFTSSRRSANSKPR